MLATEKYFKMIDEKFNNFSNVVSRKFEEINGLSNLVDKDPIVGQIVEYINHEQALPDELASKTEEITKAHELIAEHRNRINKLMDGEYTMYSPTQEDLAILTISMEEMNTVLISPEELIKNVTTK